MKKRADHKVKWLFLLLSVVMAFSIVPVQAEEADAAADTAELAVSVSGSTATFTLYTEEFDAAGFCVGGISELTPADGFRTIVNREADDRCELLVQSTEPASAKNGVVIAVGTVSGNVTFAAGSAAYLEGKEAVAYNGYRTLAVTATAETPLWAVKTAAVEELAAYIEECRGGELTAAQQEMLARCLQAGRAAIHNSVTADEVSHVLETYKVKADEIVNDRKDVDFPKLTALYDAENGGSTVISDLYPAFSPDTTAYFLYNSRPIGGMPRLFQGAVEQGVTVTFNGEAIFPAADGTFTFAVPFQALENCNTLVLTDEDTGLSSTYAFYSFGYGVSGGFSNIKVYDEEGNKPGDRVQEVTLSGSIIRFSSSIDRVRIGFDGSAAANQECLIQLVDGGERVLQSFTAVSGDKQVSQSFLSDAIQLQKGTNCLLLRYLGVDTSKWEDGKPVETPAYKTVALVINYVDPNDDDPSLADTALEKVELFAKGVQDSAPVTALQELTFQWKEKTETAPARWESTVELSPDDFDLAYPSQMLHLRVTLKNGQEISVYGGNDTPQGRTLLKDGTYHVADYYESFGSAGKPTLMKKDSFSVTITVTAKDGIHKDTYLITVHKAGRAALVIPASYQSRELTITDKRPIRTQQLTLSAVSITDAEGLPIDTAGALDAETLKVEFSDPTVASWDGKTRSGANLTVSLLKQGKTDVRLVYDDGTLHLEGTAVLYVNYTVGMLTVARSDAYDLWADDIRQYEEGAKEALLASMQAANDVYEAYKDKDRRLMNQTQFDEINDAVNALRAAMDVFRRQEIGIRIVEFVGWPEAYELPEEVPYNAQPSSFTPRTLTGRDENNNEYEIRVTWACKPKWDITEWDEKYYTFTASLEPGYVPADGVEFPTFVVLKGLRPLSVKLSKDQVKFPKACQGTIVNKTTAILNVYVGTPLEAIYNEANPNGKAGAPGLGLETGVRGTVTTWLPTTWLKIPEDFDSSQTSVESGKTFEFQFTLKPGSDAGWVSYDWKEDVPEDQKIYTMIVQIIDPPTLTVTGLEGYNGTVTINGTKTDTVFGETQVPVRIEPITLENGSWSCTLPECGEKLVPLTYDFEPDEIEGYTCEVKPSGNDYEIAYTLNDVTGLTLDKDRLILPEGEYGRLSIITTPYIYADTVYKEIQWQREPEGIVGAVTQATTQKNDYTVKGEAVGRTVITPTYHSATGTVTGTPCTVIVLPKELTLNSLSMQAGTTHQLEFPYFGDVRSSTKWESSDDGIAAVDQNGVVTAVKEGTAAVTATIKTDITGGTPVKVTCTKVTCTVIVTPADPGNGGGGDGDGSGNGGGGKLNGQPTSGGGEYRDLLTDPLPQQGASGTTAPSTAQSGQRPQTGTPQSNSQTPESGADTAESGGSGNGAGGVSGRVISVSKGDQDRSAGSTQELAVILASCSVLLAAGIIRGKKRGED
mgnify:CR=1 FL=1